MKKLYCCVTNDLNFDQRMMRICNSLQSNGYEVSLIGRKNKNSLTPTSKNYQQHQIPVFFEKGKLMYIEYNLKLFFYLLFQKIDIIIAIDLDTIVPSYYISKLKNIPRVYDAHELFSELKEVVTRPTIKKIWLSVEKYFVPRFPKGYTVSESIVEEFYKRYGVKYQCIRNMSIIQSPLVKSDKEGDFLLYQGAVNEGRGLEWLIPAMKFVDMPLVICGDGNFMDQAKSLVKYHGVEEKITFKGKISPRELWEITKKAFAGINLVEPVGLNQLYSLANKFFDYIHANIPQLTMQFPEYERINNEFEVALLIKSLQTNEIAENLNLLIQNKVLYNRLRQNCKEASLHYNWQSEEIKLLNFYLNI